MDKSASQEPSALSAEMLGNVISYLDEYKEFHGSLWLEMSYAEKVLGDISPFKSDLQRRLDHPWSPVFKEGGLSAGELKNIAVQLRQRIREDASLPKLTPDQVKLWQFETPIFYQLPSNYTPGQQITENIEITPDKMLEITSYVREKYPEIVRYWQGVPEENRRRGLRPDQQILGQYIWAPLAEAIDIFLPLEPQQSISARSYPAILNYLTK
jgi:hypothetical protein